ncbi:hypothetical protein [Candidiatus Paracoxiella cheracis]|uniref:hypothetical protein n=1 Tax=Candidiatus Paracoxiella cheracis TaxID=3405120 RepID=UPI003BF5A34B
MRLRQLINDICHMPIALYAEHRVLPIHDAQLLQENGAPVLLENNAALLLEVGA